MQNPGLIRSRLSQKEHNIITQAQLVFEASQLTEQCHPSFPEDSDRDEDDNEVASSSTSSRERSTLRTTANFQSALSDQVFSTVHRLHRRFVSSKSSSCDAMANFAELERYALYVLQMVDSCEPAMLKKIIAKVVLDKKRTFEKEKLVQTAKIRAEREQKAQINAFSAPAKFQRPKLQALKLKKREPLLASRTPATKSLNTNQPDQQTTEEEATTAISTDQLLYLFRLQL